MSGQSNEPAFGPSKGEWKVVPPSRDYPSRAMVCADGAQIYDAPLTMETQANARLIAAAPDLLAVAEVILDDFEESGADDGELARSLRAAIAKAKGTA